MNRNRNLVAIRLLDMVLASFTVWGGGRAGEARPAPTLGGVEGPKAPPHLPQDCRALPSETLPKLTFCHFSMPLIVIFLTVMRFASRLLQTRAKIGRNPHIFLEGSRVITNNPRLKNVAGTGAGRCRPTERNVRAT